MHLERLFSQMETVVTLLKGTFRSTAHLLVWR